jgi:large subunit ribosomal protein L18
MVVNRTNKNIYAQIVSIDGNVMAQSSSVLFDEKISGVEKAKIVGKNIAELCKKVDIDNIVFDKGAYNYNGRVKALADSCREFGLKF